MRLRGFRPITKYPVLYAGTLPLLLVSLSNLQSYKIAKEDKQANVELLFPHWCRLLSTVLLKLVSCSIQGCKRSGSGWLAGTVLK